MESSVTTFSVAEERAVTGDEASQEVVSGGVLGGRDGAEKMSETQGRRRRS